MKRTILYLLIVLPSFVKAHSGDTCLHQYGDNRNAWFMYFGDHKFSDKFGVHIEAQLRRSDFISQPQQLLLRTGLNYHVKPDVFFSAGYCFVHTSPYGVYPVKAGFPEHRIWQQVQARSTFGRIEWTGRLRTEQRFSNLPSLDSLSGDYAPGDAVYTQRFRLLNRITLPLKGKVLGEHAYYITAYDEIMVNAGESIASNFLDQNRAYLALGYRLNGSSKIELGYMEQTIFKSDGIRIERNHTLQVSFSSTFDFRKKKP